MSHQAIFLAGASVRSAAQSAVRSGLQVAVADLFCDRDLPAGAAARRVHNYPQDVMTAAQDCPRRAWAYTGGLENYPELVEAISQYHELWGNTPDTLRRVRDPWLLHKTLRRAGILVPEIADRLVPGLHGVWLRKPRRSCGGMHISVATGDDASHGHSCATTRSTDSTSQCGSRDRSEQALWQSGSPNRTGYYFQRRIGGSRYGAVFVGRQGSATLLGVTRQLIGCRWAGAAGFQYVGSIGPLDLGIARLLSCNTLGNVWQRSFRCGDCLAST